MLSSIYFISFKNNDKFYFGSSCDFKRRKKEHLNLLSKGLHTNPILQNLYNKHGDCNVIIEEIAVCPKEYQFKLEQWFINTQENINISSLAKGCNASSISVNKYDLNGNFLNTYSSIREAGRKNSATINGIIDCCKGEINTSSGFMWRYAKNSPDTLKPYIRHFSKQVIKYSMDGEKLEEYSSARQAAKQNNIRHKEITLCCRGIHHYGGGYQWRYKSDKLFSLPKSPGKRKPVLLYDINWKVVDEFDSITSAAKYLSVSPSNITATINGKYHSVKNHFCKFKDIN